MNRAEHPSNAKRGGVCIFYKETLGVRVVNTHQILLNALFLKYLFKIIKVILVLHIDLQAKILLSFNFLIKFWNNFKWYYNNALFTLILGDFNAWSSCWWTNDKTTTERTKLEFLMTAHEFLQLISQPTHLLPQCSSCIELIFTYQPNLIVDSSVHPSLHSNCHYHNVVILTLNTHLHMSV